MVMLLLAYLGTLSAGLRSNEKDVIKSVKRNNDFHHNYDFNITDYAFMPTYELYHIGDEDENELISKGFDVFEDEKNEYGVKGISFDKL